MSGTNQNPYPQCIKCGNELHPHFNNKGWEKIETYQTDGGKGPEIWLCPNCIAGFQHTKDLITKELEGLSNFHSPITDGAMKIYSELLKIKKYLDKINDEAGTGDSPINDYKSIKRLKYDKINDEAHG